MKPEEENSRIEELRKRMKAVTPLPDEPNYTTDTVILRKFLIAREWKVPVAEKLLKSAVEWRRSYKPLSVDCKWCHERSGFHCMRQVGFDKDKRPVIYSCFAQQATRKNVVDDSVAHCTYLIENAIKTMTPEADKWVWVMDCTGMTMSCCNPKLGHGCAQIFANCYPERLGLVIVINHSPVFQGVWSAIKHFLDPNTVAKIIMERSKSKIKDVFANTFPQDLSDWLLTEIKLNKAKHLAETQVKFWEGPADKSVHDARGCPSYVSERILPFLKLPKEKLKDPTLYKPHPNIVDVAEGSLSQYIPPSPGIEDARQGLEKLQADDSDDEFDIVGDDEFEQVAAAELEIPEEYKIKETLKTYM